MSSDRRPSLFVPIVLAVALSGCFLIWDKIQNHDQPSSRDYKIAASVESNPVSEPATAPAASADSVLKALIGTHTGGIKMDQASRNKLQTKEEFVEAFKTLLLTNISDDDAKRCRKVVGNADICDAWDSADGQLQFHRALAGRDVVGMVSPRYVSCLREKKQQMIDGFVEGSSSYNIQEKNILVAKSACLSQAASAVMAEADGTASKVARTLGPRDRLQTKDEFINTFKTLLLSNITMKDAERCHWVVGDPDICGAWDATDTQLKSDRALSGKNIVELVSPRYISCLRSKKQQMIDGYTDKASSYNTQEHDILVAKAVCLSEASAAVISEAHAH